MKQLMKKVMIGLLGLCLLTGCLSLPAAAYADEKEPVIGYIVFGDDLSEDQRMKLYMMFDMELADDFEVSTCTNEAEHKAFDKYLDKKIIGTRAVSSIQMVPAGENEGIHVRMDNISFVTREMYQNALISAGVEDVLVHVAAPFEVSGTCALLSAMNAYQLMSGEKLDAEAMDTAVDELVTTGKLGEAIGDNDEAAELVAVLKQKIAENKDKLTEEQMEKLIEDTATEMKITLDSETMNMLRELLKRLQNIDLNVDTLKNQAGELYDKIGGLLKDVNIRIPNVNKEEAMSFLQKLIQAFLRLLGKA